MSILQVCKTTVLRRYNDFLAFQEMLMTRFPYRLIPRLPPKKMMGGNYSYTLSVKSRIFIGQIFCRFCGMKVMKCECKRYRRETQYFTSSREVSTSLSSIPDKTFLQSIRIGDIEIMGFWGISSNVCVSVNRNFKI